MISSVKGKSIDWESRLIHYRSAKYFRPFSTGWYLRTAAIDYRRLYSGFYIAGLQHRSGFHQHSGIDPYGLAANRRLSLYRVLVEIYVVGLIFNIRPRRGFKLGTALLLFSGFGFVT
jgi:hypothetical protein